MQNPALRNNRVGPKAEVAEAERNVGSALKVGQNRKVAIAPGMCDLC